MSTGGYYYQNPLTGAQSYITGAALHHQNQQIHDCLHCIPCRECGVSCRECGVSCRENCNRENCNCSNLIGCVYSVTLVSLPIILLFGQIFAMGATTSKPLEISIGVAATMIQAAYFTCSCFMAYRDEQPNTWCANNRFCTICLKVCMGVSGAFGTLTTLVITLNEI